MKAKTTYEYQVSNTVLDTREAAREIQRTLRRCGMAKASTKIIQRLTTERIVR